MPVLLKIAGSEEQSWDVRSVALQAVQWVSYRCSDGVMEHLAFLTEQFNVCANRSKWPVLNLFGWYVGAWVCTFTFARTCARDSEYQVLHVLCALQHECAGTLLQVPTSYFLPV